MSLKLIYGRAKSKKGDRVFSDAVKNGGIIIVPEAFTLLAEQKLASLTGTLGLGGTEVLSFGRLAHAFTDYGPLSRNSLDPAGKSIAIALIAQRIKKDLTVLKSSSEHPGFPKGMLDLICEFKRYGVSPEALFSASKKTEQKILSSKLKDISLIYSKYNEFLASGYTDKDDDLSRLCVCLREKKPLSGRHVYLDRFTRFTPTELSLIKELMLQCASVTVTLPCDVKSFEFQFLSAINTSEKLKAIAEEAGIETDEETLPSVIYDAELSHLEKNYFSFYPEKYEGEHKSLSLFSARNVNSETEEVARQIRRLVKEENMRYKDISVIVRDTSLYSSAIKSIFSSFGIPFTDTESVSSGKHPLSVYVTSIAEAVCSGFSEVPLFRYLKSGFSVCPKEEADKLENYMLATGIHGSALLNEEKWAYRKTIFSDYELSSKEKAEFEEIDRIRRSVIAPFIPLSEKLKGKISAADFCSAVYGFLKETGLEEKITSLSQRYEKEGRTDDAAKLISVYNSILDAMDSLIASAGDTLLSAKKFNEVFTEGINATTMNIIPSSADCVNFINAIRAKGSSAPVVFIMGLNNNVFPKTPSKDGILSDADRLFLSDNDIELSLDSEFTNYEELSLLYSAFTAASDRLYLSYSLHNESGGSISPSSVIEKIKSVFPGIKESTDALSPDAMHLISSPSPTLTHMLDALNRKALGEEIDESWLKVYDWFLKNHRDSLPKIPNSLYAMRNTVTLSKEVTDALFNEETVTGVSRLEAYSACPFKYFMQYILHAENRKIAEFSPADTGSILHRYVDSVSRYIKDNNSSWQDISEKEIKDVAKGVTNEILDNSSYFVKNSSRALYLIKRLQNLSEKMLFTVKKHFESGKFEPLGSELVFGKNGDYPEIIIPTKSGNVRLTGKIDRADVLHTVRGDFLRIVDYKSGSKTFSLSDVYHGLNLQLSVYMLALNSHTESNPGAMLYFRLDDPIENLDSSTKTAPVMNGVLLDDEEVISAMDAANDKSSEFFKAQYATQQNFDDLFARVKNTVGALYSEMKSGSFPIEPKGVSSSPCDYCDYSSVCAGRGCCAAISAEDKKITWESFNENETSEVKTDAMD
ncbi:MAG: PD-(D/E)XK nuclease family protein [Clostridia bacterium]|nr:PD-(D/E)XK nuclease family protein [Clostridia bacterium]